MFSRIQNLFRHISSGTLLQRFKDRDKIRADREWKKFIQGQEKSIVKSFAPDVKLRLYRDGSLSETLYCYDFEQDEIAFLYKFLRPGDVFFDIGANVGLFTVHSSKLVGRSGQVHAFEPAKVTFERLVENVALNYRENVFANKMAISDYSGEQEFFVSAEGHDAFNSIVKPVRGDRYDSEKVQVITVDGYIETKQLHDKIRYMKVDVEGWEVPLFKGGQKTFSSLNAPVLLVEFTENNAVSAGHTCKELYELLENYGYKMFTYHKETNTLVEEKKREVYDTYVNVVCAKDLSELKKIFTIV